VAEVLRRFKRGEFTHVHFEWIDPKTVRLHVYGLDRKLHVVEVKNLYGKGESAKRVRRRR